MVYSTNLQRLSLDLRKVKDDNSLAVPRLGLGILTVRSWVQSPVRELRSHRPHRVVKKKKKSKIRSHFLER